MALVFYTHFCSNFVRKLYTSDLFRPCTCATDYIFFFFFDTDSLNDFKTFTLCFSEDHKQKFYWGHKEVLIPVYKHMKDAMMKHEDADVMISFASLRSAEESTIEAMQYQQIRSIAIVAEGILSCTINFTLIF